jgi:RHS repeat-associated protein
VLTTSYSYDDASRLDIVTDPNGGQYDLDWDPNGNRSALSQPNGTDTSYTYDTLNRLTNLMTTGPSGIIQSYDFTLGLAGNRERIDEADGTFREYTYDDLYRLTGDKVSGTTGLVYEKVFDYDPVGNREVQTTTGLGAGIVNYTYDDRDRLLTENGTVYGYDDNGNLTSKSAEATYFWDFENRLIRVEKTDGTIVTHDYDVDGNRIRTEVTPAAGPPTVTNFLVDPSGSLSHVVAETDDVGNLIAHYVRGVDDLLAIIRPTEARYYHADGLGSIRFLTDESGALTDSYEYTAFGELLGHIGTDEQPYQFAGEPFEPNVGFYYNRARWLDPNVGRFVSLDPLAAVPQDPLSLHRYLYAHVDPINNLDPTGEQTTLAEVNLAAVFVVALAATAVLRTALMETLESPLGPSIAISEVYRAFQEVSRDAGAVIYLALAEAVRQTGQRVRETLERLGKHIRDYQLIIQLPTFTKPGPRRLAPRGRGRFVLFERGGDKQRIMGVRFRHRVLKINNLIIRFDWHPVPRVFPNHAVTVHFHTPPNEDIHHFLYPRVLTIE